jgi:ADP-heptose:LPS heptosyltransferase
MKIAVLRALQLGDLLCTVPALRALDAEYPAARITLIGLPWAREFARRFRRYIDAFIEFPGFPGMPEREVDTAAYPVFFEQMNSARFDLALQMHGSGRFTNPLTVLMGAKRTAGFYQRGSYCPDAERFLEWQESEHEVLRYLRLLETLGIGARGTHLEFPLTEADWDEWRALRLERYVCVHPGAQLASRRWPPERFAQVADELAREGWRVALTGTAPEAPLVRQVAAAMREPAIELAGRTSLGALAALIGRARLVVCNDTGVSHIAAAMRTPSVVICSGADPKRWAPLNRHLHRVLYHDVHCRPCTHAQCPYGHECALGVSVHDVLSEVRLLSQQCAA